MKRSRPRQHLRRLKSGKKVTINKGRKKNTPTITRKQRKIFNNLSNPKEFNSEWGGAIDFDKKGKIENIGVIPGDTYEVIIPDDYEVKYHTHPDRKESPPTPEDIIALMSDKRQQAEMVFRDGISYTIIKTPETNKYYKEKEQRKLFKELRKNLFTLSEEDYLKTIRKKGFIVNKSKNKKQPIKVNIKPVQ